MFGKKSTTEDTSPGVTKLDGHMGSVSFDGHTVTVTKKFRGETRIPVGQIASVVIEPAGIGYKGIRFATSATSTSEIKPIGSHADVASDPNALTFKSGRSAEFEALAQAVEAAIHSGPAPAAAPQGDDLATKLANLGQLHQQGILTDDEFANAKAKLLA